MSSRTTPKKSPNKKKNNPIKLVPLPCNLETFLAVTEAIDELCRAEAEARA